PGNLESLRHGAGPPLTQNLLGYNRHELLRNMRPTWAEISLTALRHNFRTIQDFVAPEATVCAVVKADAYGHGAIECSRALEKEGCLWFAVTDRKSVV